jgi:ribosomal protein S18 acetylase RimI-like enzyme
MSISIRRANPEDVALLARLNGVVQQLHHLADPKRYKPAQADDPALIAWYIEQLERSDCVIFIAEREGEAVGYAVCVIQEVADNPFHYATKRLHIDQLSVNESQHRTGVGSALLEKSLELASSVNADRMTLGVMGFNEQAIAFYRHHQFTIDSLKMQRSLDNTGSETV